MAKRISLIISGIGSFGRNNPLVFLVYVVGYMLMCFVFIYTYTNFMPSVIDGADNRIDSRYYRFRTGGDDNGYDAEELYEYLRSYKPLYCDFYVSADVGEILGEEYVSEDTEKMKIMTRLDGAFENNFMSGNVERPAEVNSALENNEKIIVLHEKFNYTGKTLSMGSDEFSVISGYRSSDDATMSFDYFKKYFKPSGIVIVVGETLRNRRHGEFLSVLGSKFGFVSTYEPSEFMTTNYEYNLHQSKVIVVLFGVAVCVFMLLIRFLLEYSKYEYTIYRLVGAKYDTVTALVFSQVVLSNVAMILLSVVIYEVFYDSFFEKLNMYRDIRMKMTDYAFMTGILTMFSAMTIVPFILFSIKNSVAKCINYYG